MESRKLDWQLRHAGTEVNGITFLEIIQCDAKSTNMKWKVRCKCGNEFCAWLNSIRTKRQRCLQCQPKKYPQNRCTVNEYKYLHEKWRRLKRNPTQFITFQSFLDFLKGLLGDKFSPYIRFKLKRKNAKKEFTASNIIVKLKEGLIYVPYEQN